MTLTIGGLYNVYKNDIALSIYSLFHSNPVDNDVVTIHMIEYHPHESAIIYYTSLATGCRDVMALDMFNDVFKEINDEQ